MADPGRTPDQDRDPPKPGARRVRARSKSLDEEQVLEADAEAQAKVLLEDSDARQEHPATRNLNDPRVIRRSSEDATPPIETGDKEPEGESEE